MTYSFPTRRSSDLLSESLVEAALQATIAPLVQKGLEPPRMSVIALDRLGGAEADFSAQLELRSEEHTSELKSLMRISYAVFCLEKKNRGIKCDIQCPSVQKSSAEFPTYLCI